MEKGDTSKKKKKQKIITICASVAHYKKPIFIYNNISEELPIKEEVYGMQPIFIEGDLGKIEKKLH